MDLLTVDRVSYQYRTKNETVQAVKDFSYSFRQGILYALMGASGSGKTTLLSLLAGLDKPAEGTISFEGNDITGMGLDKYRLQHVSVIYQNINLFLLQILNSSEFLSSDYDSHACRESLASILV